MAAEKLRIVQWIPNALTMVRFVGALAVPVLLWAELFVPALAAFVLAALSDGLDGWAARRLNAASRLGAQLDLWADKALVAGTLGGFLLAGMRLDIGLVALVSLTVRDLLIMAIRHRNPGIALGASRLAKAKTALVMVGMGLILAGLGWPELDFGGQEAVAWLAVSGLLLLLVGCVLSVFTGWTYYQRTLKGA